ncbi:putative membrane protein [Rubidibacter lacunae KORDI 51-2]|uniref:Putative membrane protein n=1 Tax=Rubidibacter lacunae KORDI 51-2 TaxID=582515 RepID=U5DLY9_9CHRO|nr:GlsB/YeaQ/YmgE family stress response membrane protein [Rubidibacter lacunae]ERN41902.1 putative membrane protein [Rubidibacter lacunae KORDI 51-2]
MGLLTWAFLGLIAGAIARRLYPGEQSGGLLMTMLLGIIGSLVGGWLGQKLFGVGAIGSFTFGGVLTAVIGAIVVIFVWGLLTKPSE